MKVNGLALGVLVAAVAVLVGSATWVASGGDGGGHGWTMNRYGSGMMGYASSGRGEPVRDLAGARRQAERFADRLDLEVGEVMRFANNYYAELEEKGRPATEVLVDPSSGAVWLEYGPAMMWNTRFGMMSDFRLHGRSGMMGGGMMDGGSGMMGGGMMGGAMTDGAGMMGGAGTPLAREAQDGEVTAAEAQAIAQRFVEAQDPALTVDEAEPFPGYYTLHTLRNGKVTGMLSVHATTGAVWYHWWHGRFVSMDA